MVRIKVLDFLDPEAVRDRVAQLLGKEVLVPSTETPDVLEIPNWGEEDRLRLKEASLVFRILPKKEE